MKGAIFVTAYKFTEPNVLEIGENSIPSVVKLHLRNEEASRYFSASDPDGEMIHGELREGANVAVFCTSKKIAPAPFFLPQPPDDLKKFKKEIISFNERERGSKSLIVPDYKKLAFSILLSKTENHYSFLTRHPHAYTLIPERVPALDLREMLGLKRGSSSDSVFDNEIAILSCFAYFVENERDIDNDLIKNKEFGDFIEDTTGLKIRDPMENVWRLGLPTLQEARAQFKEFKDWRESLLRARL